MLSLAKSTESWMFCFCTFLPRKAVHGLLSTKAFLRGYRLQKPKLIFFPPSIRRARRLSRLAEQALGGESSCYGKKGTFASFPGSKLARRQPSPVLHRQRAERRCALPGKFLGSVPSLYGHSKVSSLPTDVSLAALKSKSSLAAAQGPEASALWLRDPTRKMSESV